MEGTSIDVDKSRRSLLKELAYFSSGGDLSMIHGQSNNSFVTLSKTRRNLDKLSSIYDPDLFNLNTRIDYNLLRWGSLICKYIAGIVPRIVLEI